MATAKIEFNLEERFPVPYRHPADHNVSLKRPSAYRHATAEDIEREAKDYSTNAHSMSQTTGHYRLDGRRAGISEDDTIRQPSRSRYEPQDMHYRELKIAECIENGVDEKGNRHVWNVREAKAAFPNFKLIDPQHHAKARFVLPTSESDIKNWKKGKELEEEREQEEKKEREEEAKNAPDSKRDDDQQESKQKSEPNNKQEGDQDDKQKTKSQDSKDDGNGKEKDEKGPTMSEEEKEFLAHVIQEQEHLAGLQNNDGKGQAIVPPDNLEMYIAEDDQFIPDNWIPRSSSLIRLTGKSPLNAEPPLDELFEAGLITPTRLHYVRSHGEVPKLDWDTHTLEVFSEPADLLPKARNFIMDDIADMDWINIPVTVACDGNRRGEVNLIKRSKGYGWGSGATSCVYWKGVPVRDLLLACGAPERPPPGKRWWLHYEGADNCAQGPYGTSIPYLYVMDPTHDVMLAYEMNGRVLHPDHGYPLRSILPGFVGGRAVKWVKKMWISEKESTNWYHIWDNRVLPSFITEQDSALAKAFYHHPSTACYEQILNSVICRPAHGEEVATDGKKYRVAGYAYAGGGTEIKKIEITLDGGKNWLYCFRRMPESPLRHGHKFWAWVHWYLDVPIDKLMQVHDIGVRAWDSSKNTQPDHITWNLSGMMNNSIFKVKSTIIRNKEGQLMIRWAHPVIPGGEPGWMQKSPEQQAKETAEAEVAEKTEGDKQFTIEEVEKHNSKDDCWIVINNRVYDVTSVLSWHPGGANAILPHAGKCHTETTLEYSSIHDDYANQKRDECYIGTLTKKGIELMKEDAKRAESVRAEEMKQRENYTMQKFRWCPVTLVKKDEISHDTRRYTFALPESKNGETKLGLPIGNHVIVGVHFRDGMVTRPYTPTRPILASEDDGTFELVVKTYYPNTQEKFPPGGTLGNYLDSMQIGEQIDSKGPMGGIVYHGKGKFTVEGEEFNFKKINLLAGGSGITPHYQLIHAIVADESDDTQLRLVNCNGGEGDMLLFDELNDRAKTSKGKFEVWHMLSHPKDEKEWKEKGIGGVGHFDENVMKERMFEPGEDCAVFLCGPPGLIEKAGKPTLEKWGFKDAKTMFGW